MSLNESLGKHGSFNILKNDNLNENFVSYNEAPKPSQPDELLGTEKDSGKYNEGSANQEDYGNDEISEDEDEDISEEVELTETEKAIDNIIRELTGQPLKEGVKTNKLKIGKAISDISKGELSSKKKA